MTLEEFKVVVSEKTGIGVKNLKFKRMVGQGEKYIRLRLTVTLIKITCSERRGGVLIYEEILSKINRRSNQEWTIKRNWQQRVHKTNKNTTQYMLATTIHKQTQIM